jgi:2-haloacid dehalogenase
MKPVAVVFDLFGTLLNIASLRDAAATVAAADPVAFVTTWREKQLAYAFASAIMETHEDFDAMTGHGARYAAAKYGIALDDAAEKKLVAAWEEMAPYDDAVASLQALTANGIRCSVLTNATPSTSEKAMANAGIAAYVDSLLSVESVVVFKPSRRVYDLVTSHYKCAPEETIFVTSNGWDATGAAAFGLQVVWCNRLNAPAETFGPPPRWTIPSLEGLAGVVASFSASD